MNCADPCWWRPSRGGTTPLTLPPLRSSISSRSFTPARSGSSIRTTTTTSRSTGRACRSVEGGTRRIEWPTTRLSVARLPDAGRISSCCAGSEPNMRWRGFCEELIEGAHALEIDLVADARSAARRHPAHPPGAGQRHGQRRGDRGADERRELALRGPDRHRRRLRRGLPDRRAAGGVVLGGGAALRRPAALPQGHPRAAAPGRGPARHRRAARGSGRAVPRLGAPGRRAGGG